MTAQVSVRSRERARPIPTMLLALVILLIVLAGCSNDDQDQQSAVAGNSQTADTTATTTELPPTTTDSTTTTRAPEPEPTTTTEPEPEPQLEGEREYDPLPFRDDPCSDRLPAGEYQFSMLVEDEGVVTEVPLLVQVLPEVVEAGTVPTLIVDFHPSEFPSGRSHSGFVDITNEEWGGAVFVNPLADTTAAPVWAKSATYNSNVLNQLWTEVNAGLCFRPGQSAWGGVSEGTQLVVEAICETEIPISYASLSLDLPFRDGCTPSQPVAINAGATFTAPVGGGASWETAFKPPVAWQPPIDPSPVALDKWAELNNCTDDPLLEVVPDPEGRFERDPAFYSYSECDAPLLLSGVPLDEDRFGPNWDAWLTPERLVKLSERREIFAKFREQL